MLTKDKKPRGRPRSTMTEPANTTLKSLDRALNILDSLAKNEHASLTDLSHSLGIPTATTHRILTTLQKHGYTELEERTQHWVIGIEAYRTGCSFLKRTNLPDVSRPIMRQLMETTGETANLAVRDGNEVVFIGQADTQNPIRAFFKPGTRAPMHASGTGKAILSRMDESRLKSMLQSISLEQFTDNTLTNPSALISDLKKTRSRGWSFDHEERFVGMSCIGAAILNAHDDVIAGISISGPSNRFSNEHIEEFGAEVSNAAARITVAIGGTPST